MTSVPQNNLFGACLEARYMYTEKAVPEFYHPNPTLDRVQQNWKTNTMTPFIRYRTITAHYTAYTSCSVEEVSFITSSIDIKHILPTYQVWKARLGFSLPNLWTNKWNNWYMYIFFWHINLLLFIYSQPTPSHVQIFVVHP